MKKIENAIIRFSGDSGDGMQLVGTQFSNTSAAMGNDVSTFPDYPSEMAPSGTVPGVSGFQVNIGSVPIYTPGDEPDILVAMNPAALKANLSALKRGGIIIVNIDNFDAFNLKRAGYQESPIGKSELRSFQVIEAPISSQTLKVLKNIELDNKVKIRCKNFYALGIIYFMYGRDLNITLNWMENTFKSKPEILEANIKSLKAGYNFAETLEASISTFKISKAKLGPGTYRHINGNSAVAYGLVHAAKAADLELFLGSYPITPATEILQVLSNLKHYNVKTFQAEDEIAAICSSIGAAFGGALAATTTSGPGMALKSEAIGLAVMLELPLVIVNVQRAGPSTGLPTKTEQADLNMSLMGRSGEAPLIVLAARSPKDCFKMAIEAARLTLKYMTPVVLLSDGFIANGSEPWKIPSFDDSPKIENRLINRKRKEDEEFYPYMRDENTLSRLWAVPGSAGFEHRVGGLEKSDISGTVSYDPNNHEKMCSIRRDKVQRVESDIPLQEVYGESTGDLLVVSWGGTYGSTYTAVKRLQESGKKVSLMHLRYINPLPPNILDIVKGFRKVVVAELNHGQLRDFLRGKFLLDFLGYNKVKAQPFKVFELVEAFGNLIQEL